MARYRDGLDRRQILLSHLMDIGTELFVMAATCSYAECEARKRGTKTPIELADLFCRQATRRIRDHFRALRCHDNHRIVDLATKVSDGEMKWLEEGIVWVGPDE